MAAHSVENLPIPHRIADVVTHHSPTFVVGRHQPSRKRAKQPGLAGPFLREFSMHPPAVMHADVSEMGLLHHFEVKERSQ